MTRLWQLLDEISGAAMSRQEWIEELRGGWEKYDPYLRETVRSAKDLACPKSGGEGCARQIIKLVDGSLRVECGDAQSRCKTTSLTDQDIIIHELDRDSLVNQIAQALNLRAQQQSVSREAVISVGRYEIAAGRGFPVFLGLSSIIAPLDLANLKPVMDVTGPCVLLVPTRTTLSHQLKGHVEVGGVSVMALEDVVVLDQQGRLSAALPPEQLFSPQIDAIGGRFIELESGPKIMLPSGTKWEQVRIDFAELDIIRLTVGGTSHRLGPDDLGLKNAKNQKPKAAWVFLRSLAELRGRLNRRGGNESDRRRIGKQKEAASKALRALTGLAEDPIVVDGDEYVACYVTNADDLQQGKQGQRQRNFVEPR
jgi:hypothetical protein|tara:strand:+ start:4737 stop:5837 length:1101 start_codon:yes stop_codon:yes gene_type:complete